MSKLDDLIKEYCPNGVEYKKLDEIADINTGEFLHKNDIVDGEYPVWNGGTNPVGYHNEYNRELECVGMSSRGSSGCSHYIKGRFWAGDSLFVIFSKDKKVIINKFLYFFLKSLGKQLNTSAKLLGGILSPIKMEDVKQIEIPIPPLEVQEYIVSILEPLEGYIAELTAELTARKTQYEGMLSKVMSKAPETKKMSEIITSHSKGTGITKKQLTEEGTPCLRYSKLHDDVPIGIRRTNTYTEEVKNSKWSDYGDLMIADASGTIGGLGDGKVNLVGKMMIGGHVINIKHSENPLYIGYAYEYARKQLRKGQPHQVQKFSCYASDIEKIEIPYYPKEEQEKIADLLNSLDVYTRDLQEGLPRLIELYKQKYEYNLGSIMKKLEKETK